MLTNAGTSSSPILIIPSSNNSGISISFIFLNKLYFTPSTSISIGSFSFLFIVIVYVLVAPFSAFTIISNLFSPSSNSFSPAPLTVAFELLVFVTIFILSISFSTSAVYLYVSLENLGLKLTFSIDILDKLLSLLFFTVEPLLLLGALALTIFILHDEDGNALEKSVIPATSEFVFTYAVPSATALNV